ncbi:MAG: class I SAM-dependent methyltransferase [Actinomycetota bacterium]
MTDDPTLSPGTRPGDPTYRAWVGNPERFDLMSAAQFSLLTQLGLREDHSLLDLGCGSLRGGRLFIPYLLPDRYFGIEPHAWLVEEGIGHEIGRDQIELKRPTFAHVDDFRLTVFGRRFDFILAQSILSHASQPMIRRCMAEARAALQPGGRFVATFLEGEEDYRGDEWVYPECVTYRRETFDSLVASEGLVTTALDWPHPAGQRWVLVTHPGAPVPDLSSGAAWLVEELEECRATLARLGRSRLYRTYRAIRGLARRRR